MAAAEDLAWDGPAGDSIPPGSEDDDASLLADINAKVGAVGEKALALLELVQRHKSQAGRGISFLDAKGMVLLSYLQSLAYYQLLRVRGEAVEGHPVLRDLLYFRTLLEKMRPVDDKLRYRVEKLLSAAAAQGPAAEGEDARPSLEGMMGSITDDENQAEEEEEEKPDDGLYKAPKSAPMAYTGAHEAAAVKAERELERQKQRLARSEVFREAMRGQDLDIPLEETMAEPESREVRRLKREATHRNDFEEDNMRRMAMTKKEKQNEKRLRDAHRTGSGRSGTMSLNDFADVSGIVADLGRSGGSAVSGFKKARARVEETKAAVERAKAHRDTGKMQPQKSFKKKSKADRKQGGRKFL